MAYDPSNQEDVRNALLTALGIPDSRLTNIELWDVFLRSQGYTVGTVLDRLEEYAADTDTDPAWLLTGKQMLVNVTPATLPSAPVITSAVRGDRSVSLTYTPADANGSAITAYTATSSPGGIVVSGLSNPLVVSEMFGPELAPAFGATWVAAGTGATTDAAGAHFSASSSTAVVEVTGIAALNDNATYRVIFTVANYVQGSVRVQVYGDTINHLGTAGPVTANGTFSFTVTTGATGSLINRIRIQSNGPTTPGNTLDVTAISVREVTSLANGTPYTFTMTATNGVGTGPASAPSASVTPATVPDAPTIGTATRTASQTVEVTFTPPASNGGSAITSYLITSSPGGITASGAGSPISVTGLTNGTPYTFVAQAINDVGPSLVSAPTNSATPTTVPGAPTNVVAELTGDTEATITFDAPASNGGTPITGYTFTSTPGSLQISGSGSPLVITGLSAPVTYTFVGYATNAVGNSANSAQSNSVTTIVSPPPINEGPYDGLYAGNWAPYEGTAVETKGVQSIPTKSTGINAPSYTDADYGTKIFRVANTTDSPNNGTTKMRHEYSRRCPFNVDGTKFILQNASGFHFVYDANTFTRLNGGVTTNDAKLGAVGTNSIHPKDPRDWTWHPTDPNKVIFFPQTDGLIMYEFDVVTHVLTTKANFTGRLGVFGNVTKLAMLEGRPSDDARYWGWQVFDGATTKGYMTYDMQTDTITGTLVTSTGANNTTMSSSGTYILISASGAGLTYAQCAASSTIRGTRAYTRDFSSFKQVHVTTTHMDVGYDYLGNECMVSLNPGSSTWTDIAQNSLFYITLADAAGPVQLINLAPAMSQWNSHYSSTGAPDRPGWCVFSAYDSTNRAGFPRYLDNNIALVELKAGGKVYRLADHRTTRLTYWQEPHAVMSRDGLSVMFSCSWDNTTSTQAALSYIIGLPSWIYGTPPGGGDTLRLEFDDATGWNLAASCSVTGGKLWCNNTTANVTNSYATTAITPGNYTLKYDISDFNAGNVTVRVNSGGTLVSGVTRVFGTDAAGHYEDPITIAIASTAVEVRVTRTGTAMDVKIDNIVFTPA